jgi:hypothetical protein
MARYVTPFTFPRSPERWVQVDALSGDGTLYQGEAGLFHVGADGKLTGFFIKNAKRFLRTEYNETEKADRNVSKEKYWRVIPGETLYLPFDKVNNLNFTYVPTKPLDTLAEANLEKMNIKASVVIQPATSKVEPKPPQAAEQPQPVQQQPSAESQTEPESQKNFSVCTHCMLNGRPGLLPRVTKETPVVSRSDGRSYHIYLQLGPKSAPPHPSGELLAGIYLAHFRYALDSRNLRGEPVIAMINPAGHPKRLVPIVETIADRFADTLKDGKALSRFYAWGAGDTLTPVTLKSS